MGTRVFVGNLSFKTKENDLAQHFQAAGSVVKANIITRGPRSLGYGFVELASEQDALQAVSLLNKKIIDDREINVQLAKPREEPPPTSSVPVLTSPPPPSRRSRRRPPMFSASGSPRSSEQQQQQQQQQNNSRQKRSGNQNNMENWETRDGDVGEDSGRERRRGRRRGGRGRRRGREGSTTPSSNHNLNRALSRDTLFVANLPFSVDDNQLFNLFQDYKVVKAHVVRKANGKSKGFGFVVLENEEQQKKAMVEYDKFVFEGRELGVNVAFETDDRDLDKSNTNLYPTSSPRTADTVIGFIPF